MSHRREVPEEIRHRLQHIRLPLCVNYIDSTVSRPSIRTAQNVCSLPTEVGTREKHVHYDHPRIPHEESVLEIGRAASPEIQLVSFQRS